MNELYILDACAVIALAQSESGGENVLKLIEAARREEACLIVNKLNLFEAYYDALKRSGSSDADLFYMDFLKLPVQINSDFSDKLIKEAARLKVAYKISVCDAIAVAEASTRGGRLVTADHHELDVIERNENIQFEWFR